MNKLIKFRALANDTDFGYAKDIIETGKFWCSKFYNLNDPMEGVYYISEFDKEQVSSIYDEKNRYVICSFSHVGALGNPLLWGYYANGFRGIAIEIEYKGKYIKRVDYEKIDSIYKNLHNAEQILLRKTENWNHEQEYRYLKKAGTEKLCKIGMIKKVYFGNPYSEVVNNGIIMKDSKTLSDYHKWKDELRIACEENEIKPYDITSNDIKL